MRVCKGRSTSFGHSRLGDALAGVRSGGAGDLSSQKQLAAISNSEAWVRWQRDPQDVARGESAGDCGAVNDDSGEVPAKVGNAAAPGPSTANKKPRSPNRGLGGRRLARSEAVIFNVDEGPLLLSPSTLCRELVSSKSGQAFLGLYWTTTEAGSDESGNFAERTCAVLS